VPTPSFRGTFFSKADSGATSKDSGHPLYDEYMALNPMGRMATPEEIAKPTVFLARYVALPSTCFSSFFLDAKLSLYACSPAASFTSGTNLRVDGALTRGVQL
jgi:3-oxoacyl-[acyl-carrier protein] reductase